MLSLPPAPLPPSRPPRRPPPRPLAQHFQTRTTKQKSFRKASTRQSLHHVHIDHLPFRIAVVARLSLWFRADSLFYPPSQPPQSSLSPSLSPQSLTQTIPVHQCTGRRGCWPPVPSLQYFRLSFLLRHAVSLLLFLLLRVPWLLVLLVPHTCSCPSRQRKQQQQRLPG